MVETRDRVTTARPRSQILYIYGGFVRRLGGWLRVSTLLDLMADLGVAPQAVRAAVARMKSGGLLSPHRRGSVAGYALTPKAWHILEQGDRRILTAREPASLADGWVIVIFSVPESQRDKRHQLRRQLSWLGFGTIASGAWIAPRRLRPEVESTLTSSGLLDFTERFDASYGGVEAARLLARKCWDLPELGRMYSRFAAHWEPVLERWFNSGVDASPQAAFRDYICVVADWRRLPFLDPGLPTEVLPDDWQGEKAKWIYFSLIGRIDELAMAYVWRGHQPG
ncbi:MAG TPA: PaaX family transcriptional regulator C-terminal domain-containing protein [Chloroflexota bacterium]|nr:PaaX family transcriptional regulator C-terminal domain-containing protein [Chloroflexota bacterium]